MLYTMVCIISNWIIRVPTWTDLDVVSVHMPEFEGLVLLTLSRGPNTRLALISQTYAIVFVYIVYERRVPPGLPLV